MKPKYQVSISTTGKSVTDIYFAEEISPELARTIHNLASHRGVTVTDQPRKDGFYILNTPVWDNKVIVEEVLSILESQGFDRDSILVK